jgi:PKD domain
MSTAYLDDFYSVALGFPADNTFASAYKGFNDSLAAWTQNRVLSQQCGQTWLTTMAEIGKYYSAATPLEAIQLVTWNDYEEGTEMESGIDNCVGVSAAISASTLSWSITGQENTLDHYTVFISTDGQNLMPLANIAAGTHALNLASFALGTGNYTLYVKAVGKPSFLNHVSGAVTYSVNQPPPPPPSPPVAKLSVTPGQGVAPMNVNASTAGSKAPAGSIASTSIDFGDGTVVAVGADGAAAHVYANAGSYVVRATIKDNLGSTSTASASASVAAAPSVTIATAARFAAFALPVHVVVRGYSGNPITQMQLSLDGKPIAQCQTSFMHTAIRLRRGAHHLTAVAKDSTGASFSATVSVP